MLKQLFILLLVVIWMSSCGGGSSNSGRPGSDGKKIFRYNQTGGLTSLDPAYANKRSNVWACSQIYNGLFSFSKNLDTHPEIVKEWDISPDGRTYTFTIKSDVYFHDNECFTNGRGREVKAEDFVYSFKRIMKEGTGSWIFNDKVLKNLDGSISDTCFKAVNDYTFKVYLKRRFPAFLQILAMPYTFVVPKEAVEKYGKDFRANPVGTGPFMVRKGAWDEKNTLAMTKNTKYWKKDIKGNQLPYLDAIQVSFVEDRNTEFLNFFDGKLDFVANISETSRDQILEKNGEIKEKFAQKFKVEKIPYLLTEYVGFLLEGNDEKSNPFLNKKVRQALSYAVNRKGMVSFLRNGVGMPGDYGVIPFALPSFDSTKVVGYPYSQKKAQELLKEAGYPGGQGLPQLKLYTYSSDKEYAEYLQKDWKALGIDVKIEMNQFATHQEMVDNGKVTLFRGSWIGDYPDAENFLAMFYSKNFAPQGPNKTHFKNAEFDKYFEEAHETDNLFTRYEDYLKMDQLVMSEAPMIILYYDEIIHLKQGYVIGLEADPMNNLILEAVDIKTSVDIK
ncbi:MAG: ABC transporter substrate-binding protein [Microscillaceae bacterium]|jgi:peptide/nickel transport system substrate-binding protein|nr:ABC transporter substrate-binding protein [Microscillaceae bacterium]